MPIRMEDDPQDQQEYVDDNSGGGGRGGGGGGLLNILPMILSLFGGGGGGGKKLIFLVILAVGGFFLYNKFGGGGCNANQLQDITKNLNFSKSGYSFSPDEFKKANVYEGLEDDKTKNPLPESVSLLKFAPSPGDQGQQGSCVAWSSVYAARTIVEAASTGKPGNETKFSPSFVYNNIALEGCQGSYIQKAMEFMANKGVVPYNDFPYTDQDCSEQPGSNLYQEAAQNRMHGFTRLTETEDVNGINIRAVKEHLAKDAPVVIGMMVGGSFMQDMKGRDTWRPTDEDRSQMGFGGHAMCVIGYDDRKNFGQTADGKDLVGGFQIQNSWGSEWGKNGVAWIYYGDFKEFVREAYGIDPMPKRGAALNVPFECTIGLVRNDNKQYIPLTFRSGTVFQTAGNVAPGTKFKMEVKNSVECYTYIFGQETDGSSYTLFPYPTKEDPTKTAYSPYCGITGYRLFPKGKSLVPDSIGNKDVFAIVVSKQPVDWFAMNKSISAAGGDFNSKVAKAVGDLNSNVNFSAGNGGTINFKAGTGDERPVYCIVEVSK